METIKIVEIILASIGLLISIVEAIVYSDYALKQQCALTAMWQVNYLLVVLVS